MVRLGCKKCARTSRPNLNSHAGNLTTATHNPCQPPTIRHGSPATTKPWRPIYRDLQYCCPEAIWHYNYGLALQKLGRREQAEAVYLKSYRLNSIDPGVLQALTAFYSQDRQWDRAYAYTEQLAGLYPNAPGLRQLLQQLEALRKFDRARAVTLTQ